MDSLSKLRAFFLLLIVVPNKMITVTMWHKYSVLRSTLSLLGDVVCRLRHLRFLFLFKSDFLL